MTDPTIRRVESTLETPRYTVAGSEPLLFTFIAASIGGAIGAAGGYFAGLTGTAWWAAVVLVGAVMAAPVFRYSLRMHYDLKRGQYQTRSTYSEDEITLPPNRVNAVPHYENGRVELRHGAQSVTLPLPSGGWFTVTTAMIYDIRVCAMTRGGQLVEAEMKSFNQHTYRTFRSAATHPDYPPLIEGVNRTMLTEAGYKVFGIPFENEE